MLLESKKYFDRHTLQPRVTFNFRVDVNSQDYAGTTALSYATLLSNVELLNLLIKHGADFNLGNSQLRTPLHHAAFLGNIRIVHILINAGT